MQKPDLDFKGKYLVHADLRLVTALHIGATEEGIEIGGMENPVIKDPMTGMPYIPGSSLKGKMRSLLEWVVRVNDQDESCIAAQLKRQMASWDELHNKGSEETDPTKKEELKARPDKPSFHASPCTCAECDVCVVFGVGAEHHKKGSIPGPTRLTVCDAYPKKVEDFDQKRIWEEAMGSKVYTEIKTENTIDRLTSMANPRYMERVPADSVFRVEFIYDVYKDSDYDRLRVLFQGMMLLEESALGGGGSRGSGRVKFESIETEHRHIGYYLGSAEKSLREISVNGNKSARQLFDEFDQLWKAT